MSTHPSSTRSHTGLRIAYVSTMPPDRGNLAEYGWYFAKALAESPGVDEVVVFANRVPNAALNEKLATNLHVQRVWKLGSTASFFVLLWHLWRMRPDVVHVNSHIRGWGVGRLVSFVAAAVPWMGRLLGLRFVTTMHTVVANIKLENMGVPIGRLTRWGMTFATWLYLRSNLVTVTLPSMKQRLVEAFGSKNVTVVPHGTYGARVSELPETPPRVLSFGFWGSSKDPSLVVDAVASLREQGVPAELVFGGGPHPYFPEVYRGLVEKFGNLPFVRFTGYVPEEELGDLFSSVSLVVLPYRTNTGASGVLNLCRSYGRPAVISADGGLMEQVECEGGAALTFQTPEELTVALKKILTDKKLATTMGHANLEVAARLTIDAQARRMIPLYHAVCNKAPASDALSVGTAT